MPFMKIRQIIIALTLIWVGFLVVRFAVREEGGKGQG